MIFLNQASDTRLRTLDEPADFPADAASALHELELLLKKENPLLVEDLRLEDPPGEERQALEETGSILG